MGVTVYIWRRSGQGIGHSSLAIGSHYCSTWPQGGANKKDFKKGARHEPSSSPNLRVDCR